MWRRCNLGRAHSLFLRAFQINELLCFIHKWPIRKVFRSQNGQVGWSKNVPKELSSLSASYHLNFYPRVSQQCFSGLHKETGTLSPKEHTHQTALVNHSMRGGGWGMMKAVWEIVTWTRAPKQTTVPLNSVWKCVYTWPIPALAYFPQNSTTTLQETFTICGRPGVTLEPGITQFHQYMLPMYHCIFQATRPF